ncbi:MAG: hypothetical protein HC769_02680 [Cyanobacteria bacterium CRU_2_1]|nr:hypothetical protein [Cyanobacteria bacterium CRU_2_1]
MSNRLLALLPALYQTDPFIGEFLLPFERILLGRVEADKVDFPDRGLEETIAELATYFDPQHTPKEFLSWLAGWAALSLRADLPEKISENSLPTSSSAIAIAVRKPTFKNS